MWYLTQELVPLCLFSKSIHQSEKLEVAKAILKAENCDLCKNREGAGYGKPVFPKIENLNSLAGCAGADSWPFFRILKINPSFLEQPLERWEEDKDYKQGQTLVTD